MVAEADSRAQQAGVATQVTHRQGDVLALPFPDGSFDACRCERLLEHLSHPAKALSQMARVTRSGGWVVALDSDWGSLSIDADNVDAERRHVRFFAEQFLANGYSGRQLTRLFIHEGLVDVSAQVHAVAFTDYAAARRTLLMDRWERESVASGAVSAQDVQGLRTFWEQADADGAFVASVSMVMVSGRKS